MIVEVKTKLNKDDKSPVTTKLDLDWTGVTQEQLIALAQPTVVIREQAVWREAGKIPADAKIKVLDQLNRKREPFKATPESLAVRASKMTPLEREALIKKLQADMAAEKKGPVAQQQQPKK